MCNIRIHSDDNVVIDKNSGHKIASCDISIGGDIVKYGFVIGTATSNIFRGETVHTNNIKSKLDTTSDEYIYREKNYIIPDGVSNYAFEGYIRENGDVGIRNEVWIIPTVGCVNHTAEIIANKTDVIAFTHQFGCSQLSDDHENTKKILRGIANNPNCASALILGLGCENNGIEDFREFFGEFPEGKFAFLKVQDVEDEIIAGISLIEDLKSYRDKFKRERLPLSKLKIGVKCGGSDAFSGITANSLIGKVSDFIVSEGGSVVLTETPEMFGAEQILLDRCTNREVFDKLCNIIKNFKQYYIDYNEPIYENPSPGNKEGGISTLEEKSLGCVQKGGKAPVMDVIAYGEQLRKSGLTVLDGPGNDIVAVSNLAAAGCQIILFSTGRGTPLGSPVPVIKISSNTKLYDKKKSWIDFDATNGETNELVEFVLEIINGSKTKSEENDYRDFSIFKNGVTL